MRDMDELPPDQRAVLSLVLTQQRSYGEVASMLGIPEQSVRERAHAALDALAKQAQSSPASAQSSRNGSDQGEPQPNVAGPELGTFPAPSPEPQTGLASDQTEPAAAGASRPSSRLGGAIMLGVIAVAVVVTTIVLSSGGKGSGSGGSSHTQSSAGATSARSRQTGTGSGSTGTGSGQTGAASGSTGSTGAGVHLDSRFALSSSEAASKASGQGLVVSQGKARAFYVTAQGLPPTSGFFYAVWLYNSQSDSYPLGRSNVGANGRLEGGGPLTAPSLSSFHRLVVTREQSQHPTHPGPIVLSGPFALH
jgi:sigma-70-like protein